MSDRKYINKTTGMGMTNHPICIRLYMRYTNGIMSANINGNKYRYMYPAHYFILLLQNSVKPLYMNYTILKNNASPCRAYYAEVSLLNKKKQGIFIQKIFYIGLNNLPLNGLNCQVTF
jgi:hypothetical protein